MSFHGTLNWKKCKLCGKMFDIGTNKELCPICRQKEVVKWKVNKK